MQPAVVFQSSVTDSVLLLNELSIILVLTLNPFIFRHFNDLLMLFIVQLADRIFIIRQRSILLLFSPWDLTSLLEAGVFYLQKRDPILSK